MLCSIYFVKNLTIPVNESKITGATRGSVKLHGRLVEVGPPDGDIGKKIWLYRWTTRLGRVNTEERFRLWREIRRDYTPKIQNGS